jgi:ankyrin repeat protein
MSYPDFLMLFFKRGAKVNISYNKMTPLMYLVKNPSCEKVVKQIVLLGANVNLKLKNGNTILNTILSSYRNSKNYLKLIEFMLKNGANANLKNNNGETALHYAISILSKQKMITLQIVNLFLKYGGDVNAVNKYNSTLLHYAVSNNSFNIIKPLKDHGAKVNIKNSRQQTPLDVFYDHIHNKKPNKKQIKIIKLLK